MNDKLLPPDLARLQSDELLIHEFFHSIQGESTHAGRPCFFIRLTGCHLRCVWCDTEYSFFDGEVRTVDECFVKVQEAGCDLVEVTGGEPLLQEAVYPLLSGLCDRDYEVLLETSGALGIDKVDPRVKRIIDWKCPGSGMDSHNRPSVLDGLRSGDELKLVIRDRADYEWAKKWLRRSSEKIPQGIPILFSPVFEELAGRDLADWVLEDRLPVRVNLQIHKFLWDPHTHGV